MNNRNNTKENFNITMEDVQASINKGETKQLLNKVGKGIIDDFNQFNIMYHNEAEESIKEISEVVQEYLKASTEEKKKLDLLSIKNKGKERQQKLDMILSIKEKFYS